MKIDNKVSFGQTYIHPSLSRYLSKSNQLKLEHSYALGQLYPMDIYLGANYKGQLNVGLRRCNLWDYLTINNEIPLNIENTSKYVIIKRMELMHNYMYGNKYPLENFVINNLDFKYQEDIAYEINDKIIEYMNKYAKLFSN